MEYVPWAREPDITWLDGGGCGGRTRGDLAIPGEGAGLHAPGAERRGLLSGR